MAFVLRDEGMAQHPPNETQNDAGRIVAELLSRKLGTQKTVKARLLPRLCGRKLKPFKVSPVRSAEPEKDVEARETGILLQNNQRQHRTSHAPKDVLYTYIW